MKYIFGLDGSSEFEISDLAEKANKILKLKPSSGLSNNKQDFDPSNASNPSGMKTLFNWKEWARFIECRRFLLKRNHVPTAIRYGVIGKMDPELVLNFAKTDGSLLVHYNEAKQESKKARSNDWEKKTEEIAEKIVNHFSSFNSSEPRKRIPAFKPTSLPIQGLVDQLLEFDPNQFDGIKQHFRESTLKFVLQPAPLATALKRAEEPHELYVCEAPAIEETYLTTAFVSCLKARVVEKKRSKFIRHDYKLIKLHDNKMVPCLDSDDEDSNVASTQGLPKLVLYQPSKLYWVRAVRRDYLLASEDWPVLSAELPDTFIWALNLIAEIIEEKPRDVYAKLTDLETIVFQHPDSQSTLKYTVTAAVELKSRLSAALQKPF